MPERADPTDDVAGSPFGNRRIAQFGSLGAEGARRRLERQLAADRNDRHGEVAVGDDDKGLEHLVGVEPEGLGGGPPEVATASVVLELVDRERHASGFEGADSGRHRTRASARPVTRRVGVSTACRTAATEATTTSCDAVRVTAV